MVATSDMVSPIRTTTAPLACLASSPVSRLITLPPMERSTILRDNEVLDIDIGMLPARPPAAAREKKERLYPGPAASEGQAGAGGPARTPDGEARKSRN